MKFPTEWKNRIHVPNHQPVLFMVNLWNLWLIYGWCTELNKYLVGGAITILKNDGLRQWVSDDIPCIKHVWNDQPDTIYMVFMVLTIDIYGLRLNTHL